MTVDEAVQIVRWAHSCQPNQPTLWQLIESGRALEAEVRRLQNEAASMHDTCCRMARESRTSDGVLYSELAAQYAKHLADKCQECKDLRKRVVVALEIAAARPTGDCDD